MGRREKSQGLAPPAVRKDIRAKQARHMVNKVIPALLASNARANRGTANSELITNPAPCSTITSSKVANAASDDTAYSYIKRKGQGRRKAKPDRGTEPEETTTATKKGPKTKTCVDLDMASLSLTGQPSIPTTPRRPRHIRIITTDTLTAAHILAHPGGTAPRPSKKAPNVCILNMASPLRPGGGVLSGATSQEEFLCARTTLLPSLHESFYRLPELGGIWSPDVLVHHTSLALGHARGELAPSERFFVDVLSAAMLRFPELEDGGGEDETTKTLGKKDGALVESKMRAVLRIVEAKGAQKVVLGAWGCGAYGNPVRDVAAAWRRVLDGRATRKGKMEAETWPGIQDVVFAIRNRAMAAAFAQAFDQTIELEPGPRNGAEEEDDGEEEEDKVAEELSAKIVDMEGQMTKVWNADLKVRMGVILEGLKAQLKQRIGECTYSGEDDDDRSSTGDAPLTTHEVRNLEDSSEEDE
ncbi:hypothetical protein ACEQ8H_002084 [Pleosporales sp. CAS-2024a]